MNSKIFLSPHNDDEILFGAYTIMREKPLVIVCTDSYIQGDNLLVRRNETRNAMDLLGVEVFFLGIPDILDSNSFKAVLIPKLNRLGNVETVYAPNTDCSNEQHKITGEVAKELFDSVVFYDTYKDSWGTTGKGKIVTPTNEEKALKKKAMSLYKSQIERIESRRHFSEVWNEYTSR